MKKILLLIAVTLGLAACGAGASNDIINPEADYLYFYGKTCPHCMEVNRYMKENETHANYSIEKREIYQNQENNNLYQAVYKSLGLQDGEVGVPFVYNKKTKEHVVGTDPVKAMFPPTK